MDTVFQFLLRRRWPVLCLGAAFALAGALAWTRLPVDAFPDVTHLQVMVLTPAEGYSAVDVEQRVTYPIEQRMGGLPQVTQLRSLSRNGLSQVVIVFRDGVDPYFARQQVFERLQEAREALPEGLEPELAPLSTGLGEIYQYTVEGENLSLRERRAIQDWLVAPRLRAVPGVTEVNSFGGEVEQVHVLVAPERLAQYDLTLREVMEALSRGNSIAGAGLLLKGWEQMTIRGEGLFRGPEDIGAVVLRAERGRTVCVRDVAEVVLASGVRQGAATRDGRGETVCGMTIMLRGENSRTVVTAVKEAVAAVAASLPDGARLEVFYDRTALIEACVETVTRALLEGGLLVILVLFLFLAELRTALLVVLSLPVAFLYAFLLMEPAGLSSNLMSLGGLAFSVGMVVDASIVAAENIRRHLAARKEGGERRDSVVARAMSEVARPIAFSVLVIALVLLPLLALQGMEGKMFRPLALTLLFSLLTSLVVALVLVPPLSALVLKEGAEREFPFVRRFRDGYLRLLGAALEAPRRTLAAAAAVFLLAMGLLPFLGTEFLPPLDEGSIVINVVRLPNASLEGTVATSTYLERRILAFPEVATVVTKSGSAEISEDPMGPEQSDLFVMLKPRGDWKTGRSKAELVEAIRAEMAAVPGLRASFSQPIALRVNELISGVKSDLAVKVFGPDLTVLKEAADRAAALLSGVAGAADIKVEQASGMAEVQVVLDRQALARYGLNTADVNEFLEAALAGRTVSSLTEGERRLEVAVRFPESARHSVESLGRLLLPAPGGERVSLGQVSQIRVQEGPMQVSREMGMRRVVVEANVRGRDMGGFVEEAQSRLAEWRDALPPGYWIEYGGQFENQQRAMRQLAFAVPAALVLVLLLLYSALGGMRNALLVLANLPLALAGGVVAAVAFRMSLSVSAAVAFIVLLGVAVQNGVLLVAFFRQLRQGGATVAEAVGQGCRLRFNPLLMTALTSFIGHLPMVYATGAGADIQKPLAVIVMGGILTSTLLTLVVLPVLYHLVESWRPGDGRSKGH